MHPENRFAHNWLAKKLVNDMVRTHVGSLRGVVVDLGCGTRPYEHEILGHADRYVGVDWSHTLHGLHADVVADLARPLPFMDGAADCVTAFEVLEHVAEPAALLAEANRILKPGGCLMLSVPFQWWVHEAPWDFYRFTRHGLEHLLAGARYHHVRVHATSGFWTMWVLKLNYQLHRLIRGPRAARYLARAVLTPVWWLGQQLAPLADGIWPDDRETVGYFVTAQKQ